MFTHTLSGSSPSPGIAVVLRLLLKGRATASRDGHTAIKFCDAGGRSSAPGSEHDVGRNEPGWGYEARRQGLSKDVNLKQSL